MNIAPERGLTKLPTLFKNVSQQGVNLSSLLLLDSCRNHMGAQALGSGVNLSPVPALVLVQPCGCGHTGCCRRRG